MRKNDMEEEIIKKVKVIIGKNASILDREIEKFAKDHEVLEVKRSTPFLAFVFYMELPEELKLWK